MVLSKRVIFNVLQLKLKLCEIQVHDERFSHVFRNSRGHGRTFLGGYISYVEFSSQFYNAYGKCYLRQLHPFFSLTITQSKDSVQTTYSIVIVSSQAPLKSSNKYIITGNKCTFIQKAQCTKHSYVSFKQISDTISFCF